MLCSLDAPSTSELFCKEGIIMFGFHRNNSEHFNTKDLLPQDGYLLGLSSELPFYENKLF